MWSFAPAVKLPSFKGLNAEDFSTMENIIKASRFKTKENAIIITGHLQEPTKKQLLTSLI